MRGDHKSFSVPEQQVDSVTIVAAPVSGTKYEWRTGESGAGAVLGTQTNVKVIGVAVQLTWATTQPTPLEIHFTVDGVPIIYGFVDPVTATYYFPFVSQFRATASQVLSTSDTANNRPYLMEGRSVKIECEITWATTQPTNLTMRVKWAKW